jgi:hypothetical protein
MPTTIDINDRVQYTGKTGLSYTNYQRLNADLAKLVYKPPGARTPTFNTHGYQELPQYATEEFGVFLNPSTKHAIVSFKGTSKYEEWWTSNIHTALNTQEFSEKFNNAKEHYDMVVSALGSSTTVDVTGHSLGGAKALFVAAHSDADPHATVFNPGIGVNLDNDDIRYMKNSVFGRKFATAPNYDHYVIVRNKDDLASMLYDTNANVVTYKNNQTFNQLANPFTLGYDPIQQHGIDQFTSSAQTDGTYNIAPLDLYDVLSNPVQQAPRAVMAAMKAHVEKNLHKELMKVTGTSAGTELVDEYLLNMFQAGARNYLMRQKIGAETAQYANKWNLISSRMRSLGVDQFDKQVADFEADIRPVMEDELGLGLWENEAAIGDSYPTKAPKLFTEDNAPSVRPSWVESAGGPKSEAYQAILDADTRNIITRTLFPPASTQEMLARNVMSSLASRDVLLAAAEGFLYEGAAALLFTAIEFIAQDVKFTKTLREGTKHGGDDMQPFMEVLAFRTKRNMTLKQEQKYVHKHRRDDDDPTYAKRLTEVMSRKLPFDNQVFESRQEYEQYESEYDGLSPWPTMNALVRAYDRTALSNHAAALRWNTDRKNNPHLKFRKDFRFPEQYENGQMPDYEPNHTLQDYDTGIFGSEIGDPTYWGVELAQAVYLMDKYASSNGIKNHVESGALQTEYANMLMTAVYRANKIHSALPRKGKHDRERNNYKANRLRYYLDNFLTYELATYAHLAGDKPIGHNVEDWIDSGVTEKYKAEVEQQMISDGFLSNSFMAQFYANNPSGEIYDDIDKYDDHNMSYYKPDNFDYFDDYEDPGEVRAAHKKKAPTGTYSTNAFSGYSDDYEPMDDDMGDPWAIGGSTSNQAGTAGSDTPLNPAHGKQGHDPSTTIDVPPRQTHQPPPGQTSVSNNYTDRTDDASSTSHYPHQSVTDVPPTPDDKQYNLDPDNHIHHDNDAGKSTTMAALSDATQRFNALADVTPIRGRMRNFTEYAVISDYTETMARNAADWMAS